MDYIVENVRYTVKNNELIRMRFESIPTHEELENVCIPSRFGNQILKKIGSKCVNFNSYKNDDKPLMISSKYRINTLYIPDSVEEIGDEAFKSLSCNDVVWSNNCKKISKFCFSHSSIKSIKCTDNVEIIEQNAFEKCVNLKDFFWPEKCSIIPFSCFEDCFSLKNIYNIENVNEIQGYAFKNCKSLISFTIPENVNELSYFVFSGCNSLEFLNNIENIEIINHSCLCNTNINKIRFSEKLISVKEYSLITSSKTIFDLSKSSFIVSYSKEEIFTFCGIENVNNIILPYFYYYD